MPDPNLLQQQRHLLRSFRKGGAQRVRAEFISEANHNAERQAADQAHASARAEAEAGLAKANADAQARRKTAQTSADAELTQVRQTAGQRMARVANAQKQARTALDEARFSSLVQDTDVAKPALDLNRQPVKQLDSAVRDAIRAAKAIPGLVQELSEERTQKEGIRFAIMVTAALVLVMLIIVLVSLFA